MKIITKEESFSFIEKKSKFLSFIKPVNSVKEANDFIEKIRKEHSLATHNVPVYRVIEDGKEYFKYNDDGEPSGTAAKPIADIIERKDVYNVALVVTRYFGGIKLGAGGLIRNYARAAKEVLGLCEIVEYVERKAYILSFPYSKKPYVDMIIENEKMDIIEQSYLDKVNIKLYLSQEELDKFLNIQDIDIVLI